MHRSGAHPRLRVDRLRCRLQGVTSTASAVASGVGSFVTFLGDVGSTLQAGPTAQFAECNARLLGTSFRASLLSTSRPRILMSHALASGQSALLRWQLHFQSHVLVAGGRGARLAGSSLHGACALGTLFDP